jgi:hypothetical protein
MSATTPTINGSGYATAIWGMDGSVYTGKIVSFTHDKDADNASILDNNGYISTDITFNEKDTFTLELVIQSGTTLPTVGTVVTIDSIANCIVRTVGKTYGEKDWRKFKFTAVSFINLTP